MNNETNNVVSMEDTGMNFAAMNTEDLTKGVQFEEGFQAASFQERRTMVATLLETDTAEEVQEFYKLPDYFYNIYSLSIEEAAMSGDMSVMTAIVDGYRTICNKTRIANGGGSRLYANQLELDGIAREAYLGTRTLDKVLSIYGAKHGSKKCAKFIKNVKEQKSSQFQSVATAFNGNLTTKQGAIMKAHNVNNRMKMSDTVKEAFDRTRQNVMLSNKIDAMSNELVEMQLLVKQTEARTLILEARTTSLEATQETLVDHATLNLTDINSLKTEWHRDLVTLARAGNKAAAISAQLGLSPNSVKVTYARLKKDSYFL